MSNKLTTSEAAKLLGIHPDTMRKRARAGKVKFTLNDNGHLQFDLADLGLPKAKINKTYVDFIIDRSGSMAGLHGKMESALKEQLGELVKGTDANNEYFITSTLFSGQVAIAPGYTPVQNYLIPSCRSDNGMTSLYDALGDVLTRVDRLLTQEPEAAFLVVVTTDGGENSSKRYRLDQITAFLRKVLATDRVTVTANCPPHNVTAVAGLGIPAGNINGWTTDVQGFQDYTTRNSVSVGAYTQSRSAGVTSSTSYYANVGTDQDAVAKALAGKLDDVTKSVDAKRVEKQDAIAIRNFADAKFGGFVKGKMFYQLTKSEKVQSYKDIIVQDGKTGKFFKGWDTARQLLGLPKVQTGEIRLAPGKLGDFKVFVQSTSYNRKLVPGTAVLKLG